MLVQLCVLQVLISVAAHKASQALVRKKDDFSIERYASGYLSIKIFLTCFRNQNCSKQHRKNTLNGIKITIGMLGS